MKTAYKPSIISPYQTMQKKTFDTQDKKHPVREEIQKDALVHTTSRPL